MILDRDGQIAGVGATEPAGRCARRGRRAAPGGGAGARRHRGGHPGTVQPPRPHPAVRGCAARRRGGGGGVRRRRSQPGGRRRRGAAGRRRRRGRGRGAGRRRRQAAHCANGCTSSAPGCRTSRGSSPPASTAAAPPPTACSQWITSEAARADVHRRRAAADAIVVGTGTVLRRRSDVDGPAARRRAGRPAAAARGGRQAGDLRGRQGSQRRLAHDGDPHPRSRTRSSGRCRTAPTCCWRAGPRWPGPSCGPASIDRILAYVAPILLGGPITAVDDVGVAEHRAGPAMAVRRRRPGRSGSAVEPGAGVTGDGPRCGAASS